MQMHSEQGRTVRRRKYKETTRKKYRKINSKLKGRNQMKTGKKNSVFSNLNKFIVTNVN
jgi:hypothetical protein